MIPIPITKNDAVINFPNLFTILLILAYLLSAPTL